MNNKLRMFRCSASKGTLQHRSGHKTKVWSFALTLSGMDDVQGRRLSTMLCQCESFIIMSNRAYRQNRSNPHKYQCCYLLKQTNMSIGTARGIDSTYCIHGLPRPSIRKKPSSYRINRRWLCRARARQCHSKVKNEERQ